MSKYIKENSFAGFFLSSLNNHNKESVMRALKKVKVDEKIPILNKDTNVTDYTRSDYYLGREVNKYLEIDFLDCNYEHAILFDRFLIPTFNSFEVYPHFESLNNLVDGMIFYKFELPEIYNYKLDKLKKMTGYKDINDIIQRARKNITNRHIDVRYDKSDIYELINILNDKYNMQDSLNRLLRSYAAQSIDLTMYDNLYPNPYKIVEISNRIKRMCIHSSHSFNTEYTTVYKFDMIMKSIINDLKNKFGNEYESIIFSSESGLPTALKYLDNSASLLKQMSKEDIITDLQKTEIDLDTPVSFKYIELIYRMNISKYKHEYSINETNIADINTPISPKYLKEIK